MRRRANFLILLVLCLALGFVACAGDEGSDGTDTSVADSAGEDAAIDAADPDTADPDGGCVPDCEGKVCGDDGCGGSCGDCLGCEGEIVSADMCVDGACPSFCCPDCTDRECGDDGCGGACGDCEALLGDGAICGADGLCEVCAPDCEGKECGDDGCGGSCGDCGEGGTCIDGLCPCIPDMGPAGRVRTIHVPTSATEVGGGDDFEGAACFDLDGDGEPDNGIPQPIITMVLPGPSPSEPFEDGTINLLLELRACDAAGTTFDLVGYDGLPTETPGEYEISPNSFGPEGEPLVLLPTASLSEGTLAAGPASVTASYEPLAGLAMPVNGLRVAATSASLVDDGLEIAGGSAGAYIFREDLADALAVVREACAEEPPPFEECQYVGSVEMDTLDAVIDWDLDLPGCGLIPPDADGEDCRAVSLCLFFAAEPVIISGIADL